MIADDPVLEILKDALADQTKATQQGFADLKAEMATTRRWVLLIPILGMILQAAMVGVGLNWSGAGSHLTVTPGDTVEPEPAEEARPSGPLGPLDYLDPFLSAQATTDGTAPQNAAGYEDPEPRGDP